MEQIVSCQRAVELARFAEENSYEVTLDERHETFPAASTVDLTMATFHKHPETGQGWEWGVALRWYSENGRWRMGAIDPSGRKPIAGNAMRLPSGTSFDFWLGSVKYLRGLIVEPEDFVALFEKWAPE